MAASVRRAGTLSRVSTNELSVHRTASDVTQDRKRMDEKAEELIDIRQALLCLGLLAVHEATPRHTQLSGGLTNDNVVVYLDTPLAPAEVGQCVRVDSTKLVLRRFRSRTSGHLHYDRQQEDSNTRMAASAGVGPTVLGFIQADGVHGGALAVRFAEGQTLAEDGIAQLCRTGQGSRSLALILRRLHAMPVFANAFEPIAARLTYEEEAKNLSRGIGVRWPGYEDLLRRIAPLVSALHSLNEQGVSCHNDLLAANVIVDPHDRLVLIDYELSGTAPASWELGNIVSEAGLDDDVAAVERLVRAYWLNDGDPLDTVWLANRVARVRAWSIVSKVTWSAWGCVLHLLDQRQAGKRAEAPFDYASWSMDRVRRASAMLKDEEAMRALLLGVQAITPDEDSMYNGMQ